MENGNVPHYIMLNFIAKELAAQGTLKNQRNKEDILKIQGRNY